MGRRSGRSRRRSQRTVGHGPSVRRSFRSGRRRCNRVAIPSGSRWATSWPALRLACWWEGRTGTCRRTTSTSNAGSNSPKGTSAVFTATATPGSGSCRRGLHYCWPLMPTWSIPSHARRPTSGPTGMPPSQHVSVRLCIAARSGATRAQRNVAPSYSQTWNAAIVRELSFLPDRCYSRVCPEDQARREKQMMAIQRWVQVSVSVLLGFVLVRDVAAWGDAGHQIICEIAFQELQPQAREAVQRLLQQDPDFTLFSKACTWPDHPRKRASEHFVNLSRAA